MTTRKMSWVALFIALSVVGASIKIPAIVGSVALDSAPALIAVILLGGPMGSVVAVVGHLLSALLVGFPLGPFHLIIAIEMAVLVFLFQTLYRKNRVFAYIVFILGNAVVAPLPFYAIISAIFYYSVIPSILIGSILNSVIAFFLLPRLAMVYKTYFKSEAVK